MQIKDKRFYEFVKLFNGIPVDFSNPRVNTEDYKEFDYAELTTAEYGSDSQCEVTISYISSIERDLIKRDYLDTGYENEDYVKNLRDEGESEEDIKEILKFNKREKENAREWYELEEPCNFRGYVATPDLSISLQGDVVQAMITSVPEKFVILYGTLDNNKRLEEINISTYDNMLDFAMGQYDDYSDFIDVEVDCDRLIRTEKDLMSKGIFPEEKISLNFNQFLNENGLNGMVDNPIGAIYEAKELLLNKILENKGSKKK